MIYSLDHRIGTMIDELSAVLFLIAALFYFVCVLLALGVALSGRNESARRIFWELGAGPSEYGGESFYFSSLGQSGIHSSIHGTRREGTV